MFAYVKHFIKENNDQRVTLRIFLIWLIVPSHAISWQSRCLQNAIGAISIKQSLVS